MIYLASVFTIGLIAKTFIISVPLKSMGDEVFEKFYETRVIKPGKDSHFYKLA